MSTRIRDNQVLPDTTEQELLALWPTLVDDGRAFLLKLFSTILPDDAPLLDQLADLQDRRAYDAAVGASGLVPPIPNLLATLPAPEAAYIQVALAQAVYESLDDGTIYGAIPGLQGVWADRGTQEQCARELASALHDWITAHQEQGSPIPTLAGMNLNGA